MSKRKERLQREAEQGLQQRRKSLGRSWGMAAFFALICFFGSSAISLQTRSAGESAAERPRDQGAAFSQEGPELPGTPEPAGSGEENAGGGNNPPEVEGGAQAYRAPWYLILVDEEHPLPEDFAVEVQEAAGIKVDQRIASELTHMLEDAAAQGVEIRLTEGYRSPERQRELYQKELESLQARGLSEEESRELAGGHLDPPGAGEDQTGLAVRLAAPGEKGDPGDLPARQWLENHAGDYGFILRYPEGKEEYTGKSGDLRHYRYVGVQAASRMKESGLCLEEYLIQEEEYFQAWQRGKQLEGN